MTDNKINKQPLLGKTLDELKEVTRSLGMPDFAAKQIADWIYKKRAHTIQEMTNISLKFRTLLDDNYEIGTYPPSGQQCSTDGTIKYLFQVEAGKYVETVYIPDKERATLCISSQVGCKMNCLFCMTGKQGFKGNLTARQIFNQIHSIPQSEQLTNIVFMGMGEPLDNIEEVLKTIQLLTAEYSYAWSPKRITVSTVGLLPGLKRLLNESDCHIAVSLHAPYTNERGELMPVEKAYPIVKVIDELSKYDFSHQRRLSFEYIVFKGVNDSTRHIKGLKLLLNGLFCRINLIRFHAIPNVPLTSPSMEEMEHFRNQLSGGNIICTIRASRGEDILAACGMLSTAKQNN